MNFKQILAYILLDPDFVDFFLIFLFNSPIRGPGWVPIFLRKMSGGERQERQTYMGQLRDSLYKVEQRSQRNRILFDIGLIDRREKITSDNELTVERNRALVYYAEVIAEHCNLFMQTKLRRMVLQRSRAILRYWDMYGTLPKKVVEEYFHLTGIVQDRSQQN